jgi:hypothetical protein
VRAFEERMVALTLQKGSVDKQPGGCLRH